MKFTKRWQCTIICTIMIDLFSVMDFCFSFQLFYADWLSCNINFVPENIFNRPQRIPFCCRYMQMSWSKRKDVCMYVFIKKKSNCTSNKLQTQKRFKTKLFSGTKYNMQIFGLIPFITLQNYTWTTVKRWKTTKKLLDGKLIHLSFWGWAKLFYCPVTPKIYRLCFGPANSVPLNCLRVWSLF